jgi:hypothetical protein
VVIFQPLATLERWRMADSRRNESSTRHARGGNRVNGKGVPMTKTWLPMYCRAAILWRSAPAAIALSCSAGAPAGRQGPPGASANAFGAVVLDSCVHEPAGPVDSIAATGADSLVVARALERYVGTVGRPGAEALVRSVHDVDVVPFFREGRPWLYVSVGTRLGSSYAALGGPYWCRSGRAAFEYDVAADSIRRPRRPPR